MRQAVPEAKIISLNPIFALGHRLDLSRSAPATGRLYLERAGTDFSCYGFEFMVKPEPSLVLFDDHQKQDPSLTVSNTKGFRHLTFEQPAGQATHLRFFTI